MRSRIVLASVVASLTAASLLAAACGSDDRPPVSSNPFGNSGDVDGETTSTEHDGGAHGILVTFPDAEVLCRTTDGSTMLQALPPNDCLCAPVTLRELTVTLPCGYGLCVAGGPGAVCEANRTLTLHELCPEDGGFPPEWAAQCLQDQ